MSVTTSSDLPNWLAQQKVKNASEGIGDNLLTIPSPAANRPAWWDNPIGAERLNDTYASPASANFSPLVDRRYASRLLTQAEADRIETGAHDYSLNLFGNLALSEAGEMGRLPGEPVALPSKRVRGTDTPPPPEPGTRTPRKARSASVDGHVPFPDAEDTPAPVAPPAPAALKGPAETTPGYIYHATNTDRLGQIAETGNLSVHSPNEYTDQDAWPDGSIQKRNYFTPTANNTWQFAPEEGTPALLRVPKDAHPVKAERGTGDLYSTQPVPAHKMEYLGADGGWHPVVAPAPSAEPPTPAAARPIWDPNNPVGASNLLNQSVSMPSPDVSPVVRFYGRHPLTAADAASAARIVDFATQFGPADVASVNALKAAGASQAFPLTPRLNPDAPGFADRISTTLPSGKGSLDELGEPLAHGNHGADAHDIGLDKIIGTSAEEKAAAKLQSYPDVPTPDASEGTRATFGAAVSHMKDNLRWIYDNMDPAVRDIARKWYDGANSLTKELADTYAVSHRAAAGLVARLSPSTDWYQNMSMAKRILKIRAEEGNTVLTSGQQDLINKYIGQMKDPKTVDAFRNENAGMYKADGTPKTYDELDTNTQKAMFIRSHDEASWVNNPRNRDYAAIHPEGRELGPAMLDDGKTPSGLKWQSFDNISNGLNILDDDALENISQNLGDGHKIRSFYNNIISPNAGHDITVDTHQIAASHLLPLGSGDPVVSTGMRGAPEARETGSGGLYGVYAEATRQLAHELRLLPREAQSITWEGLRSLYPRGLKLSKPFVRDAREIMNNAADPATARTAIGAHPRSGFSPETGYIQRPDWFGR